MKRIHGMRGFCLDACQSILPLELIYLLLHFIERFQFQCFDWQWADRRIFRKAIQNIQHPMLLIDRQRWIFRAKNVNRRLDQDTICDIVNHTFETVEELVYVHDRITAFRLCIV